MKKMFKLCRKGVKVSNSRLPKRKIKVIGRGMLFFFLWGCALQSGLYPVQLENKKHPNHYILLIDATGSTVDQNPKVGKYKDLLSNTLMEALYEKGVGGFIPVYDPEVDYLSLFHFGVVKEENQPYKFLENYDLPGDYIHSQFTRESQVFRTVLVPSLWPEQFYRLTLLLWSKKLALATLLDKPFDMENNRTFMIVVHDGIVNNGIPEAEIEMARSWGGEEKIPEVEKLIQQVDKSYIFSSGRDKNGKPVTKVFRENHGTYFIEGYEVLSKEQLQMEEELNTTPPFVSTALEWVKETGANPQGRVEVTYDRGFLDLLKASPTSTSLTFRHRETQWEHQEEPKTAMDFLVIMDEPLGCQPLDCRLSLDVTLNTADPLLGKREFYYHYDRPVKTPVPFKCKAGYVIQWGLVILAVIIFLLLAYKFCYFRYFTTQIRIKFPSLGIPVTIKRTGGRLARTPIHPTQGGIAFWIMLPKKWRQKIFYKDARIDLDPGGDHCFYLLHNSKKLNVIHLPINERKIGIYWEKIESEPVKRKIVFSQGKQNVEITLAFPKGIAQEN